MSLRIKPYEIRSLDWDPVVSDSNEIWNSWLEWAVDQRLQVDPELCWAACLAGALSAVGRYKHQSEIAEAYFGDDWDPDGHHAIESAKKLQGVWRQHGFTCAKFKNQLLKHEELFAQLEEEGPVQAEFWEKGQPKRRHLVLFFGARASSRVREVKVADPMNVSRKGEWLDFDQLSSGELRLKHSPSFGSWRRTYCNLGHRGKIYIRRFFSDQTSYFRRLGENPPEGDARAPTFAPQSDSALRFRAPMNKTDQLIKELTAAILAIDTSAIE